MVPGHFFRLITFTEVFDPCAAGDIQIEVAVLVKIKECSAAGTRFNNIVKVTISNGVNEVKPDFPADLLVKIIIRSRGSKFRLLLSILTAGDDHYENQHKNHMYGFFIMMHSIKKWE